MHRGGRPRGAILRGRLLQLSSGQVVDLGAARDDTLAVWFSARELFAPVRSDARLVHIDIDTGERRITQVSLRVANDQEWAYPMIAPDRQSVLVCTGSDPPVGPWVQVDAEGHVTPAGTLSPAAQLLVIWRSDGTGRVDGRSSRSRGIAA